MTGMAEHSGSSERRDAEVNKKSEISRAVPDLIVRFNGKEFLPSDETPLGSALLGNLAKRDTQGRYVINFDRPYLVDLCIGGGAAFTTTPLSVTGFVLGESPSGNPSILSLMSVEGKRVKLPVVVVTEQGGEWRLVETALGRNRDLIRKGSTQEPMGRHVSFNGDGVFLVVLREDIEGVLPMPLAIHSVVVTDQGRVLKARSNDGRVFEPNPEPIESSMPPLPPAPKCLEGDEEYSLAPIESQQQPMAFAADLTSHNGVAYTKQTHRPNWTPLEARDFRIELALRRLFVREKAHVSKENAEVLVKIITSSTEKVTTSATVLTDTCKRLVLTAGGNSRAQVVSGLCRKWIEDHHNRSLWKELVWRDYYEDLTIIAPLLCGIESDLNRAEVSAYDAKLAERRKR